MAMRMAYALQLHRELDHDPLCRKEGADLKLSATDREIRRRTMWACFMMDRFNSSGTERPTCASEEHIKIQLPNKEFNFHNEALGPTEMLDEEEASSVPPGTGQKVNPRENMGVASYVVRIIVLWGRVIRYLNLGGKEKDSYDLWHPKSEFGELKRKAEAFKASLPADLQYNAENLATMATEKLANQFLFLHISYNQVVLFLHRYAIPTIPGALLASDVPKDFLSASAQAGMDAADQISGLISHASEHNVHVPFAGYCAFTSSTVHIWSMFSNHPRLQASAKRNLGINVAYIRKMEKFWGMFHFMHDNLIDIWQRHKDHATQKATGSGDASKPDGSLFQYGDWFQKYPHGVSETDYEDPASKVKEECMNEASNRKTDLQSVEDFFNKSSPQPRPAPTNRKPVRKQSKRAVIQTPPHPPLVLPQDVSPNTSAQSMVPMPPQTPVDTSPFSTHPQPHPPQLLYPTMPPQTYDILGQPPNMSMLPNLDRNMVYDAYAGTSGPSIPSADASFEPMTMGGQATGVWEQAMAGADAQAQAAGPMGTYMGDFQQSSAWFMPFNMPPPTAFYGGGQEGYGGFVSDGNQVDGMGGAANDAGVQ